MTPSPHTPADGGVVLSFTRKTYAAKEFCLSSCGLELQMSGTLDGAIDLCITTSDGKHLTYLLDPDGMRQLAAAALCVADDVEKNCLYDADPLLMKGPKP